jgi:hypothetical protein
MKEKEMYLLLLLYVSNGYITYHNNITYIFPGHQWSVPLQCQMMKTTRTLHSTFKIHKRNDEEAGILMF